MSSNSARLDAIRAITTYKPEPADFNFHETSPMDVYSCNVFNATGKPLIRVSPTQWQQS